MKTAYFDTVAGIAGDMTLAAFIGAGMSFDLLVSELKKLPLEGFDITANHVRRSSIDAVHIDVVVSHQPHFHRDVHGITSLIEKSTLMTPVKETARRIFMVLGEAEAAVHNQPLEKVHFHEVGAVDSIVDIVGTAICLHALGIERVYSSPVRLGQGGVISTQHGPMPSPAPATLQILRGYPVIMTNLPYELTTPTGAAIIKALSAGVLTYESFTVQSVGYGAGTKEFAEIPNFLRVVIGELPSTTEQEDIVTVETNIDDMNPQVYPFLIEELLAAGAHDAYLIPIVMKKGRPGILLSVMTPKSRLDAVTGLVYRHTTTIGLRIQEIGRVKLPRRHADCATSFGPVRVKIVLRDGREVVTPEFEECKRIARETGKPIAEIMRHLEQEVSTQIPR